MFPDYSNSTVEQLLHKQLELKQKLLQAGSTGMSQQVISQLQNMIEHVNNEIQMKSEIDKLNAAREEGNNPDETVLNIGDVE